MAQNVTREHMQTLVHNRLRNSLRLYLLLSIVLLGLLVYRLVVYKENLLIPLLALVVGLILGLLFARVYAVQWDAQAQKVVSRLDIYGIIFICAYIALRIFGDKLIVQYVPGADGFTLLISLACGLYFGRGFGMQRKIVQVLREHI